MFEITKSSWDQSTTWYDNNPDTFIEASQACDTSKELKEFCNDLPKGCSVLDFGCGSGRDLRWMLDQGFDAHGLDGSAPLINHCSQRIPASRLRTMRFQDYRDEEGSWHGIWAMAALLHLPRNELSPTLGRLLHSLRPGGDLFATFKYGEGQSLDARGRPMTYLNEAEAMSLLYPFEGIASSIETDIATATDSVGNTIPWINIKIRKRR